MLAAATTTFGLLTLGAKDNLESTVDSSRVTRAQIARRSRKTRWKTGGRYARASMIEGTRSLSSRSRSIKLRAATLRVTKGPDAGRAVKIDQPSFVIGVGEGADFRLTDPAVSREHLRFALQPTGIRVRDADGASHRIDRRLDGGAVDRSPR